MDSWLQDLLYWHWWLLALVLLLLEMFAPGVLFLWMGLAAGVMGIWVYFQPDLMWQIQVFSFAVFSVLVAVLGRWWVVRHPVQTNLPHLNRRAEQYLDRVFTLHEAMENGVGRLRVDDTSWKVSGPDCAAGTQVRVVGVDGVILRIECVDKVSKKG